MAPLPARGPDTAGVRVPPPAIYLAAFAAGAVAERLIPTPHPSGPLRLAAAVAGVTVAAVSGGDAARRFLRERTALEPWRPASALVTSGPYRFTRNPMYVGMAALYAGLAVGSGRWWSLAALPVAVAAIDRTVIAREERYLERRFGDDYRRYRSRVRRWL